MISTIVKNYQDNTIRRGVDWSPVQATTVPYVPVATAFSLADEVLVAVNQNGSRIHYSTDLGHTWTQAVVPTFTGSVTFSDVCYGHGMFVAVGVETITGTQWVRVLVSTDLGLTWTQTATWAVSTQGSMTRLCATSIGFAGVGNSFLRETTDGTTWDRETGTAHSGSEIASNGTGLIICYPTGLRVRDAFGLWTDVPLTLSASRYIGVIDNKYFVSVWNAAKTYAMSEDNGMNWDVRTHALTPNANNRGATGGGKIVLTTTTANKLISTDGKDLVDERTVALSGGRVGYAANRFFLMTANSICFSY